MAKRPNIVLIMTDQWRGDCLSIADHPVVHTPYLDQLATQGVRLSRAYCATPTCIAARASLYTGTKPETHGRVGYLDGVPWNYDTTLAGEFTRHGYQTQAVGKMHVYPERSLMGFQHVLLHDGFINHERSHHPDYERIDDYIPWLRERAGATADYFEHGVHCNSNVARPWDKPEHLHPTNWVTEQSIRFLKRRDPRRPFFLFTSYHRPHPPYDPPAWALQQYLDLGMPGKPVGDWAGLFAKYGHPKDPNTPYAALPEHLLHRARAGYYGHMTHIDYQINRLIWSLKEFNLLDETYIMFVSDHGEMMGDHHQFRKGVPYEGSSHVPLILKGPPGSDVPENAVCDALVELRDIMPTLLACAGLPVPNSVEGYNVLPVIRGEKSGLRNYLHGEHVIFGQSIQWLTDGHEKYIWFSETGHEQLFDLDEDPHELHDLAQGPGTDARVSRWRARLVETLTGREEGFVADGQLVCGRPVHPVLSHLRHEAGIDQRDRSDWHKRGVI